MSFPPSILGPNISEFKKDIGYDELKSSISDLEIVLLNWPLVLEKFSMDGHEWVADSRPEGSPLADNRSEISTHLSLNERTVRILVNVFSSSNLDAISLPLEDLSRISASFISMRRLNEGPGDMYLTMLDRMDKSECYMVFKNVSIQILTKSEADVRDFADYLIGVMSNAVVQKSAYQIPEFNANISTSTIKLGDEFTVTINAVTKEPEEWRIDLRYGHWPNDRVETTGSGPHEFSFKALKPGPIEINFDIFHTKSLMSYMKKVHLNVLE